jgi:syntaxin-binding protein 1
MSQWKVLVVDEGSRKLIDNVVSEDDILTHNVTSIYPFPIIGAAAAEQ